MTPSRGATTFVAVALLASLAPIAASAQSAERRAPAVNLQEVGDDYNDGKPLPLRQLPRQLGRYSGALTSDQIGKRKYWLAIDDIEGVVYAKRYKLRGVGDHIEVWVANDSDEVSTGLGFPAGDCRNDERIRITDRQVNYLIRQFEKNIYPKESRVFSRPPDRNGRRAILPELAGLPRNYYRGEGDKIVTLIDNVRDSNFYDTDNSTNDSYIAGFFYSLFNEYVDRNVMSIDSFDWLHRTRANPPHEPVAGDLCNSASARPYQYESVFAHEYQHLLEYYEDVDEREWINEGISDWAQSLTGYVDPRTPITEIGFDGHIWGFLGYLGIQTDANPLPRTIGGPENSLTEWIDQGDGEVLADYGAAYAFMELLHGRFGNDGMRRLHRNNANGLAGLANILGGSVEGTAMPLLHDWAAAMAIDGVLDDGAVLTGGDASRYQVDTMDATVNWASSESYSTEGAPPNGSDYVRLRAADGSYLAANQIQSIEFDGSELLTPLPVEWTSVTTAPGAAGDAVLWSGSDANSDRSIVQTVTVPQTAPTLSFETAYEIEEFWDFGFVQVSTDGGKTWTSLSNADTTSEIDPGAIETAHDNLPGYTGTSGCERGAQNAGTCETDPTWSTQTFDLTPYAGQEIMLGFRSIMDTSVNGAGWWIDDIKVGTQTISTGENLTGWKTMSEINPFSVAGFTVQLVAYDDSHTAAWIAELPIGSGFDGSLSGAALTNAIGSSAQTVGAIVTYDDPTETATEYAPYSLTVNGVVQPGG